MFVSIEKVAAEDVPRIKRIEIESALSGWSENDYRKELEREDSLFYLAKFHEVIAGFALARLITIYDIDDRESQIEIYNIAVSKEFRRHQIASKMLSKIISEAERIKASEIHLEVRNSNKAAIALYRKCGFEVSGTRKNFYGNPTEDALLMCRLLNFTKNP